MPNVYLLTISILISISCLSQDKKIPRFDFDNYEFPKAIIVQVENKNKAKLKQNIQNWLSVHYSKSTLLECQYLEDTFIIKAKVDQLIEVKNLTSEVRYNLRISLRDSKYRLEITSLRYKYYTEYRPISNINLIMDEVIKKDLDESRSILSSFFNNLNLELYESVTRDSSDW
ncbi:DUF4468 domain-containing protein [Psychroflexus sediminis]|uniref:Uncharacterized protein n=1 Tax=Psychroflexus sediminis TaxID=470826 RepID=A0A1G7WTJ1_9FLAO|nr:DUF4468 domain-containing protein [Psychroflexus sediminis]SDG75251.1 protein of unknown function [Psychroflexus sediminis]